jgi:cell division septum initiation protein DivIVA
MKLTSTLHAPLAAACLIVLAGCTDLEPIRDQIDDLKSQLGKLQTDTARATAAANAAAANASSVAEGAQNSVSELKSEAEANSKAIVALDEKIDRMFKRPLAKTSVTAE